MADLWEPVSGVFMKTAPLLPSVEWVTHLGDSSFFTTVFGALAGAFAGAWAAQHIAERSKLREELQREIRNINTAILLASTTCNLAYALKKQHIKAMKESYDAHCRIREERIQLVSAGIPQPALTIAPNLDSLHEISPPVGTLLEIVLGRLSTTGRALAAATGVSDAIQNLNNAINKRNELIERIKDEKLPEGAQILHFYFGTPYAEGKANREYGGYVQALASYTDDALFFCIKLCEDLRKHGLHVAEKHKKKFGGDTPRITHIDWRSGDKEGLMPKDEAYKDWLVGYQNAPEKKRRWWQRKERSAQPAK